MRYPRAFLVIALIVSACGGSGTSGTSKPLPSATAGSSVSASSGPEILPLLVNSEIVKGPTRFLFSLTDRENRLVAAPDVRVRLEFFNIAASDTAVAFQADARFLWAIEGAQGLYVAQVEFPNEGRWGTRFVATFPDGAVKSVRADYDVRASGTTPAIGAQAPSVETPTAADVKGELARVTTDKTPNPRLYEVSVADALGAKAPFVLTFATPAFCDTALCGPTLDTVKTVADDYPDLTFINVEPYKMAFTDGRLQPELDEAGQLQTADWTNAWGLVSEPYTFVVGADGKVAAKLEGVIGADELRDAIDAVQ